MNRIQLNVRKMKHKPRFNHKLDGYRLFLAIHFILAFMLLTKTVSNWNFLQKIQEQTGLSFHVGYSI